MDNKAEFFGGGIRSEEDVEIVNTTFSTNSAEQAGGIFGSGSLHFVTMVDNSADEGQPQDLSGTFEIYRSLFTSVETSRDDTFWRTCGNSLAISGENNLIDDNSCGSDPVFNSGPHNTATALGELGYWGGRTRSYALEPTSFAEDGATNCRGPNGVPISMDQRGVVRPQGNNCDIGAFEFE